MIIFPFDLSKNGPKYIHILLNVIIENYQIPLINNLKSYTATNHEVWRRKSIKMSFKGSFSEKDMGPKTENRCLRAYNYYSP